MKKAQTKKKPDSISPEALAGLQRAQVALQSAQENLKIAQNIYSFVATSIGQQYELNQGDTLDSQTGKISYKAKK